MSLRKNLLICLVSAMAFGMYACADDPNTVESNDPAPAACTADACQDDNTLLQWPDDFTRSLYAWRHFCAFFLSIGHAAFCAI